MQKILRDNFYVAVKDYKLLLDKNYPQREILRIVGNRYGLSKIQRTLLYRGVFNNTRVQERKMKLTNDISHNCLYVDGFNVLFTITNYLLGKAVFLGNDHILRDAGEISGKNSANPMFLKAIDYLIYILKIENVGHTTIYLDKPVSRSKTLNKLINTTMMENNIPGKTILTENADKELNTIVSGILATSDTVIIDHSQTKICDIARISLDKKHQPNYIDLSRFVK